MAQVRRRAGRAPLIVGGLVATTARLDAEAPANDEYRQAALGGQRSLASTGRHRAVGMPTS